MAYFIFIIFSNGGHSRRFFAQILGRDKKDEIKDNKRYLETIIRD